MGAWERAAAREEGRVTVGTLQATTGESLNSFVSRLVVDTKGTRESITAPPVTGAVAAAAPVRAAHDSKVCSVLLPIYAASDAQKSDVYKGYDKVTVSPAHQACLPKWNVSEEKLAKYKPMY